MPSLDRAFATSGRATFIVSGTEYDCEPFSTNRKPLAAWPLPLPAQPTNNALVPVCNCAAPPADWPLMLSSAHCLLVAIAGMEPSYAANAAFAAGGTADGVLAAVWAC